MPNLQGWEFFLGEVCIGACLVFSIYYFNKARKTEEGMSTLKTVNFGIGVLFLALFISRILDNPIADMVDPAKNLDLFGILLSNQSLHDATIFFHSSTIIVGSITVVYFVDMVFLVGLAIATFFMERAFIPKAHHVFFIFLMVCAFVSFAYGPITGEMIDIFSLSFTDPVETIFMILGLVSFAVIPIIYFIVAGKTTGELRRNALFLAIGFICILVDIHTVGHERSGNWYRSIPCLLGFFLIAIGNKQK
jgi:hypothetical protein